MGSEAIHFEALRKQMIIDRRNAMNITRKVISWKTIKKKSKLLNFVYRDMFHHFNHIIQLPNCLKMTCFYQKTLL